MRRRTIFGALLLEAAVVAAFGSILGTGLAYLAGAATNAYYGRFFDTNCVDCIKSDEESQQFFIDPDICIDCGACQPVCPVNAIFPADEVPPDQQHQTVINAEYFKKAK